MSSETYKVVIQHNGTKFWYQNDQLHRLDGPACEWSNGTKHWYQNGLLHRLEGPAVELSNGTKAWYIEGEFLNEKEFNKRIQKSECADKEILIDGKKYKLVERL